MNAANTPDSDSMFYDLLAPSRIVFGSGRLNEAGQLAVRLGQRAFVVSGSRTLNRNGQMDRLTQSLQQHSVQSHLLTTISHEPEVADVDAAVNQLLQIGIKQTDLVIGFGGGSAIDLAKAVAALVTNRHGETVLDFLEGVGKGLAIENDPLPMLAIPTTAGTGSEATKNAVISSYEPLFKKSLRSDNMVPNVVLVDPEVSLTVPRDITAASGMDAITQLIESYISRKAKPIPQALCIDGLKLALPAIETACSNGADLIARERMAQAALLSGIALANSGLGMAHGVAAALGVHCKVPHGLACAVMLPTAMSVNADVAETQICELASAVGISGKSNPSIASSFVNHIRDVCAAVQIPDSLSKIGVQEEQIPAIVKSSRGNSMNGNPKELSDNQLTTILQNLI